MARLLLLCVIVFTTNSPWSYGRLFNIVRVWKTQTTNKLKPSKGQNIFFFSFHILPFLLCVAVTKNTVTHNLTAYTSTPHSQQNHQNKSPAPRCPFGLIAQILTPHCTNGSFKTPPAGSSDKPLHKGRKNLGHEVAWSWWSLIVDRKQTINRIAVFYHHHRIYKPHQISTKHREKKTNRWKILICSKFVSAQNKSLITLQKKTKCSSHVQMTSSYILFMTASSNIRHALQISSWCGKKRGRRCNIPWPMIFR